MDLSGGHVEPLRSTKKKRDSVPSNAFTEGTFSKIEQRKTLAEDKTSKKKKKKTKKKHQKKKKKQRTKKKKQGGQEDHGPPVPQP